MVCPTRIFADVVRIDAAASEYAIMLKKEHEHS
jgi:hypothetical protein